VTDWREADANIQSLAGDPLTRQKLGAILSDLLAGIADTADPDRALVHWDRYVQTTITRGTLYDYLRGSPRLLHYLCIIFGNSPAMADTVIRDPTLVYWLSSPGVLDQAPSPRFLRASLDGMLGNVTAKELQLDALRRFKRREMLRIGMRDLLRLASVPETTTALSGLASVLIHAAYGIVEADLRHLYGRPQERDRRGTWVDSGFSVIGMGKLGGQELNYSSDVDLIYVYSDDGMTTGPADQGRKGVKAARTTACGIPNEEYFERLARELTHALTDVTAEGIVFRVDLRLRAEGTVGQLSRSLTSYEQYYATRGQTWERMALLKAAPVAGDPQVGRAFLRRMRPFILGHGHPTESDSRRLLLEVRGVKDMIDRKVAKRGQESRNVKLGTGGIREIEFLVQSIQLLGARRIPAVWQRGTQASLERFREARLLTRSEAETLADAYVFLRDVEHKLQMVHDLQTHALPEDAQELTRCAVRLGYDAANRSEAMTRFLADHRSHTEYVNGLFRMFFVHPEQSSILRRVMKQLLKSCS
jgi:glutamate-ammonia-ligase adenylyltransferase